MSQSAVFSVQSAGGQLAQARMRGDKEAELIAQQRLAEARLSEKIESCKGHLTLEAAERLCALLREAAAAA